MNRLERLRAFRDAVAGLALDALPGTRAQDARDSRGRIVRRLDDHIIARAESVDAPLLCVLGGPTGSGKSTVLNSIVGQHVTASSAIRPTTRRPLLLHRAEDAHWFEGTRILPGMPRIRVEPGHRDDPSAGADSGLLLEASEAVPPGLALLDAPDLDSIVQANRDVARQLMDAADLWLFVTTAARYADAVPWELLAQAEARDIELAVILNRVPDEAAGEVEADLRRLLTEAGLEDAPIFTIREQPLIDELIPSGAIQPARQWLRTLAADAEARADVVRRTLTGAVMEVTSQTSEMVADVADADHVLDQARRVIDEECQAAVDRVGHASGDGSMLRGEVLARWQDVVGTTDFMRTLNEKVSWIRDRVTAALRGRPAPTAPVEDAIQTGLAAMVTDELSNAVEHIDERWRGSDPLEPVARAVHPLALEQIEALSDDVTLDWQHSILEMVRNQGGSRRVTARIMAVGVNVIGVALMIVIFASTGGVTGAEIGVGAATAAVAQKLLEAVFGDQAVRTMARQAHETLLNGVADALDKAVAPYREALPDPVDTDQVETLAADVRSEWAGESA